MARKGMAGQLNMFDFFNQDVPSGEVEMVSLMPNFEEEESVPEVEEVPEPVMDETTSEPEVEDEPEPVKEVTPEQEDDVEEYEPERKEISSYSNESENAVMSRVYEIDGEKLEIAYLNYNKVRITKGNKEPEIKVFDSSKEAVDYYVEKMQELEVDE